LLCHGVVEDTGLNMKLVKCDGRTLEVRDVSEPVYKLQGEYIPVHGYQIMEDDEARKLCKSLKKQGAKVLS